MRRPSRIESISGNAPIPQLPLTSWAPDSNGAILVVDDDSDFRRLIATYLRETGYEVIEIDDPQNALELMARGNLPIKALITDYLMPKMNGDCLIQQVRNLEEQENLTLVSIIILMSSTNVSQLNRLTGSLGICVLPKSSDKEALVEILSEF